MFELTPRERELASEATKRLGEMLILEAVKVRREVKDGNDPYAQDLSDKARELTALSEKLR